MKVGDLVRWTSPNAVDVGIIRRIDPWDGEVYIVWSNGFGNGFYNPSHAYLELVSEAR